MLTPKTASYGSWKSPITSDLVAQSITLSEPRFDGEDVYWLEGRPQEFGRLVVVRANTLDGHGTDVHIGMIPHQPHEPAAVRRETRRSEKIMPTDQHPSGIAAGSVEINGYDRVDWLPVAGVIFHARQSNARLSDR